MPRINRNNLYNILWQFFRTMFRIRGDFDCGTANLAHGKWVLFFDTVESPANVWFSTKDECSMPVCGGSTTLIGASMAERGFYLYADVRSNETEIDWFISEY